MVLFNNLYDELRAKTEQCTTAKFTEAHSVMVDFRRAFANKISKKRYDKASSRRSVEILHNVNSTHDSLSHRKTATVRSVWYSNVHLHFIV